MRRAVLVTGGGTGIGAAVTRQLRAAGDEVAILGRRPGVLAPVAAATGAVGVPCDVSDAGQVEAAVSSVIGRFGRLDGLAHAAGIVRRGEDIRNTTDQQWSLMRNINLDATFRLARACLREMVPQRSGSVVLVGSQLAQVGAPGYASYCAVKGGVEALVRALAVDFGPSGIRVNSLTPGLVQTPLAYVDRPDFDDQIDAIAARLPLRRIGQPDDMAGPAVFLLSDDSAWMTGQSLVVDGGYTIQ